MHACKHTRTNTRRKAENAASFGVDTPLSTFQSLPTYARTHPHTHTYARVRMHARIHIKQPCRRFLLCCHFNTRLRRESTAVGCARHPRARSRLRHFSVGGPHRRQDSGPGESLRRTPRVPTDLIRRQLAHLRKPRPPPGGGTLSFIERSRDQDRNPFRVEPLPSFVAAH